jgi:hypothetical protein
MKDNVEELKKLLQAAVKEAESWKEDKPAEQPE